ncbi:MAG: beta-ketoacyl synthase N-terminal-like domain-containing protein, partial [Persicimonas sp.]
MSEQPPIAIVGVSALFPGSSDAGGFWRDILAGKDLLTDVPPSHWLTEDYYDPDPNTPDKTYADRGAFLSDVDFSPMDFGVPPNILSATDSSQLLALIVAKKLLEDAAQGPFENMDRERVGVVLGVASTTELCLHMAGRLQQPVFERAMRQSGLDEDQVDAVSKRIGDMYVPWEENTFPGLLGNVVSGRIANRFDLGGTNAVIDAACASSLAALEMGINKLHLGQADMMITGGVDALNDILMYMCFSKTGALSKTGDCRPFAADGDGTMMAEGLGMFALKRLEDAEADDDKIYAVIRGVGSSSDGRAKSIYAPRPEGQSKALWRAYEEADYSPRTVELLEAHGTATNAGDAAEVRGLKAVFNNDDFEGSPSESNKCKRWCALGSVKSQIGHAKAAAGAAGLFKTVMALNHRVLPPTIKVDQPNPDLELEDSPLYINSERRPWIRGADHPRRASVSAFGFGGTNFHITLEEYKGKGKRAPRLRTASSELVLLSADSPDALIERCEEVTGSLDTDGMLTFLAKSTQESFDASQPARLAVVAGDDAELAQKLAQASKTIKKAPEDAFSAPNGIHYGFGLESGDVAVLFPGQGSQYIGMGGDVAVQFERAGGVWDRAADLEFDDESARLHEVVFPPPAFSDEERDAQKARLTATEWAQPAIGAASLSMLRVLEDLGLEPACVGGHSYGEVTALSAAGVLGEREMLEVSRKRGELMANASSEPGSMTAVSATIEELEPKLDTWDVDVVVANHNSPRQVVLSGATAAIDQVEELLAGEKISFKRLPVSTAFHSSLVSDSSVPFLEFLEDVEFGEAAFPVYANSEAAPYPDEPAAMRRQLAEQIAKPVRFVEQIEDMYEKGARTFVEVGPRSILTRLVGKCLDGRDHHRINVDRRGKDGVNSLNSALGYLSVVGVSLDFAPLWSGFEDVADPRDAKESAFTVPLNGANYDKPYPPENHEEVFAKANRSDAVPGVEANANR